MERQGRALAYNIPPGEGCQASGTGTGLTCLWFAWRELFAGSVHALGSQNLYSKQVTLLLLLTAQFPQGEEALTQSSTLRRVKKNT